MDEHILSLDTLVHMKVKELQKRGTQDGTTRELLSTDAVGRYDSISDNTFGIRPKYPSTVKWDKQPE